MSNGEICFERHFDGDNRKNALIAPLIDGKVQAELFHGEPNIHSGSFNNAKQFYINVFYNTFYSQAKKKIKLSHFLLVLQPMHFSRNDCWMFIMPLEFYCHS